MKELKLGSYVNCKHLTNEQAQKLLDKWKELLGGSCVNYDKDIKYFEDGDKFLVFYKNCYNESVIYFRSGHPNDTIEMFYEDFFPEESEQKAIDRPKTIDLTRKTEKQLQGCIDLSQHKTLESLANIIYDIRTDHGMEPLEIELVGFNINFYETVYSESEEAYQQRVQREKHLNDWYNQELTKLTKENLELKMQLKEKE